LSGFEAAVESRLQESLPALKQTNGGVQIRAPQKTAAVGLRFPAKSTPAQPFGGGGGGGGGGAGRTITTGPGAYQNGS
jgi:hypothetical protein